MDEKEQPSPTTSNNDSDNKYRRLAVYAVELLGDDEKFSEASWIFLWTVIALAYAANLILLFLFIRFGKMTLQSPTNVLILSLVLVDLATLFVVTLVEAYFKFRMTQLDVCVGVSFSVTVFSAVFASLIVSVISGQKFIAVFFPFQAKSWLKRRNSIIAACASFVITVALVSPLWAVSADVTVINDGPESGHHNIVAVTGVGYVGHAMSLEAVSACLAATAIFVTHPAIICKLCGKVDAGRISYKAAIKLAAAMVIVFVFYLTLSLSKYVIWYSLAHIDDVTRNPGSPAIDNLIRYWVFMSDPISILHIVFNPILHALVTENFRKFYSSCAWARKTILSTQTGVQVIPSE